MEIRFAVITVVGPTALRGDTSKNASGWRSEDSHARLELGNAQVLNSKSLPLLSMQVSQVAVVVRDNLKAGLVEPSYLLELCYMVVGELALGMVPAVPEGDGEEVHVQSNVAVQTTAGDAKEEGGVMG